MELDTTTSFDSPMKEEEETLHSKITKEYGRKIIDNLKKKQIKLNGNFENNEIKSSHRKQMVVWMEEVLTIFKCPAETFFMSVQILDRYLENSKTSLKLSDLHEIGITSMFIASKYQEVEPLTLDLMIHKVAHGKITEKAIKSREINIACTLKFKFGSPTVLDFLESYFEIFSPYFVSDDKVLLKQKAIKIAKNSIVERKYAFKMLPAELALNIIMKTLKKQEKSTGRNFLTDEFSVILKLEFISDESLILPTDEKALFLGEASHSIERKLPQNLE